MSEDAVCPHCGQEIAIRNPSGYCDHLYYPRECAVCSAREQRPDERVRDAAPDLLAAVSTLLDALLWCSGAADFNPEGKARSGFQRIVLPAVAQAFAALDKAKAPPTLTQIENARR